jgi:hypothetical protein
LYGLTERIINEWMNELFLLPTFIFLFPYDSTSSFVPLLTTPIISWWFPFLVYFFNCSAVPMQLIFPFIFFPPYVLVATAYVPATWLVPFCCLWTSHHCPIYSNVSTCCQNSWIAQYLKMGKNKIPQTICYQLPN